MRSTSGICWLKLRINLFKRLNDLEVIIHVSPNGHLSFSFVNISVLFIFVQLSIGLLDPFRLQFKPGRVPVFCCRLYFVQPSFLFLVALDYRNLLVHSLDFCPGLRPVLVGWHLRVYLLVESILFGCLFRVEFWLKVRDVSAEGDSKVFDFLALLFDLFFEELKPVSHSFLLTDGRKGGLFVLKTIFNGGSVNKRVELWRWSHFDEHINIHFKK